MEKEIKAGYVVVLQLVGRAGNWNPHLHIIMTGGGQKYVVQIVGREQ